MINSLFRRFIKILDFGCSSFFPEFQVFSVISFQSFTLSLQGFSRNSFQLSLFVWSFFYYWSSSWRLYMVVRQGFLSFFNCPQDFLSKLRSAKLYSQINMVLNMSCFEEFKHSSSCIPKCNSFYLIFWGGVMSFLTISLRCFTILKCQEGHILNPSFSLRSRDLFNQSISSLELSWVIFHLKPSLRNVAIVVLINDPSSSFILPVK